jgi:hypothetical protein
MGCKVFCQDRILERRRVESRCIHYQGKPTDGRCGIEVRSRECPEFVLLALLIKEPQCVGERGEDLGARR